MATEIVVADDQELMRLGFRIMLSSQPDLRVTGEASDGEEAAEVAFRLRPDVMLMDVRMPRVDGISAASAILDVDPEMRIILVSTFDVEEYRHRARPACVSGLLPKDVPPAQLLDAIRRAARGLPLVPTIPTVPPQ